MTNPIKILSLNRRRRALEADEAAAYFRRVRADLAAHAGEPLGADDESDEPAAVAAAPEESASTEPDTTPTTVIYTVGGFES